MIRLSAFAPLLSAVGLTLAGWLLVTGARAEAVISIDVNQRFQTIRGWETSDRVWETDKKADRFDGSWIPLDDRIAQALVNEVGINNLRLHLGSGTENPRDSWRDFIEGRLSYTNHRNTLYEVINDNDDPMVANPSGFVFTGLDLHVDHVMLPMQRALAARGERLFVTLTFVDFNWTDGRTQLVLAKNPAEYGELILAAFRHLDTTYGFVPDALEMILEPENTDHWSGRAIGQAIVAVTDRLAAAGYTPQIIAPSTTWAERAVPYMEDIASVPGAAKRVSMLAYHRYGRFSQAALPAIAGMARQLGIETGMLEFVDGTIDMLIEDLTVGNISAWQQYGVARKVVNGKPGASPSYYLDAVFTGDSIEGIALPLNTRMLAVVFRAWRAGAVRIAADSDDRDIDALAALRPEGGIATILRVHAKTNAVLTGLPEGPYTFSGVTDGGKTVPRQEVAVRGASLTLRALPEGVYSLIPGGKG